MFKPIKLRRKGLSQTVKGLFSVPYEDRLKNEKWSSFFGKYQAQKLGRFDTFSCWALASVNSLEDQLEWLWKKGYFNQEAKDFFTKNGYIDGDGDFSISERYIEILSGFRIEGGSARAAWAIMKKGIIPRSKLTYTDEKANTFYSQEDFNNDYFNPSAITQEMRDLATQSLKYINIDFQQIGKLWTTPNPKLLIGSILQAPLNIGIPIPKNVNDYNREQVIWDKSINPQHEVELYEYVEGDQFPYKVYDQYKPWLKELSDDYYIPLVHQGIVTAKNPVFSPVKETTWQIVWRSVIEWFRNV